MLDMSSHTSIFVPALVLVFLAVYRILKSSPLSKLPLLNAKKGEWFSYLRTKWRNTFALKDALNLAYAEHKDETMLLAVMGHTDTVIVPSSEALWLIKQPNNVLSMHDQTTEDLQINQGTYFDQKVIHDQTANQIINTKLNSQIGNLIPTLVDELKWTIGREWGTETKEFREVCVYETQQMVECNVSNRVFVGLPLSRDQGLQKAVLGFAQAFPMSGVILGLVPSAIRSLAAPFVTMSNRRYEKAFIRIMRSAIERRLEEYKQRYAGDVEKSALEPEPNDFLQWSIQYAMKSGDAHLCKVETLAGLQLLLNFASIHTSSFAMTHVILDLASSKPEFIDELREEIKTVLAEHNGVWNKQALLQMTKLDSTMRESQRLNLISPVGIIRKVAGKDGLTTPQGVRVPRGTSVAISAYSIHYDPNVYGPDVAEFKPFRFAKKRGDQSVEYIERAKQAWAATSAEYMAFGGGRNACPGRFFASAKIKLMLAHILMSYDFEMQDARPENLVFGLNHVPPMKATIRVRRRDTRNLS